VVGLFYSEEAHLKFWRTPLDHDEIVIPHGQITVIAARCKGCGVCETYCPRSVIRMSAEFNPKGYHVPEVTDGDACVACGLCQIMCPEFAIYVTEIRSQRLEVADRRSGARV
jgi:2-oxoglutarate ferredoxin oxidoreductase subunit delta